MKSLILIVSTLFLSCNEPTQDEIEWKKLEAKSHVQDSIEVFNLIAMKKTDSSINWTVNMLMKFKELNSLERQRDSIINTYK